MNHAAAFSGFPGMAKATAPPLRVNPGFSEVLYPVVM